jgi:hypothetical protein
MKKTFTDHHSLCMIIFTLAVTGSAPAVIVDLDPAPFRGQENTTIQGWDFLTNTDPSAPDNGWVNPYGDPSVDVVGNAYWLQDDGGHSGVWIVDSEMVVSLPSCSDQNRRIWLQIVYSAQNNEPPMVYLLLDPAANTYMAVTLVAERSIDGYYRHAVYSVVVPSSGKIWIRPRDCQVFIDSILVETQCTTSPVDNDPGKATPVVDLNPAPFRGKAYSTFQAWSFSTNANPAYPDVVSNSYGQPWVDLIGGFANNTIWVKEDSGHQGLWIVDRGQSSNMSIKVKNLAYVGAGGEIWLQIVYASQGGNAPMIYVLPDGGVFSGSTAGKLSNSGWSVLLCPL